jgi:O-antigen/teichoic acid export membrane protein
MFDKILKLGKETLIYGASTIAARLFNFFLTPLYTYCLITSDYGVAASIFAFMALINIAYQYGMDQAYLRYRADEQSKAAFSTPFIAVFCAALLFSLLIFAAAPLVAQTLSVGREHAFLIKLSAVITALDALSIIPFAKLRFEHRPWRFVSARAISIFVNVAANVAALAYFKTGIKGIFYAGICASLASLLLLISVIKEDFQFKFDFKLFKSMLKFSWPFVPAGMASILVNVIDKPLLSRLAGLSEVGIYQANFKIGVFMMLFVSMFDQAWRPFFIQHSKEAGGKELFAKVFTCFSATAVCVFLGLSLIMPAIIKIKIFGVYLLHPAYWGGLKIIPLVLAGYLFYGFYINFMVAPVVTKKTAALTHITLLGALTSVAVNITLVPRVGIVGAGWAILASYFVMALSLFIFLQRNYPIKYEYKKLSVIALLAFCGGVLLLCR